MSWHLVITVITGLLIVRARSFKRLNELYATTGQVGFLASERVDGKLILSEAVKTLDIKAAGSRWTDVRNA